MCVIANGGVTLNVNYELYPNFDSMSKLDNNYYKSCYISVLNGELKWFVFVFDYFMIWDPDYIERSVVVPCVYVWIAEIVGRPKSWAPINIMWISAPTFLALNPILAKKSVAYWDECECGDGTVTTYYRVD